MKKETKNYIATFSFSNSEDTDLILDIDDLHGIIDQLTAIQYGWTDPLTYFQAEIKQIYKWEADEKN